MSNTFGSRQLSRRDMLRLSAMTAAGALAVACAPAAAPTTGGEASDEAPSAEQVAVIATTSMPVNTFDDSLTRAAEQIPHIALEVNANGWGNGGWDGYSDTLLTRIALRTVDASPRPNLRSTR